MEDVVVQILLGRKPRSAMALPWACEVTIRFRHQDAEKVKTHVRLTPGPCVVFGNSFTLMLSIHRSNTRSSSQLTVLSTAHLVDTPTPCHGDWSPNDTKGDLQPSRQRASDEVGDQRCENLHLAKKPNAPISIAFFANSELQRLRLDPSGGNEKSTRRGVGVGRSCSGRLHVEEDSRSRLSKIMGSDNAAQLD